MIDLHSHVLPGVDDGPGSMDGSLEILRAAAEDGIARIAATPHVRDDYPTAPATMERLVDKVNAAASAEGTPVEVLRGGELALEAAAAADDETLRRFGLGGNPSALLLEFPYRGWPLELRDLVFRLETRGYRIVLAHPERNAEVQAEPERLRPLVDAGVLVQLTAASVDGRLGRASEASARTLLDAGLAHLIASDAHAPAIRAVGMAAAAEAVGDEALARWLTHEVPAAILDGTPPPPRPARRTGRRLPWRH
ncbi:MAG TPA: CpsB/CapC family capsule biosynthesis tyrosine phosphatase [Gaiellaceae bacterium]|nr:CpsB/CapC family capsule biosynthesis tyrosine phosphatase [Gaiellaceae bacterium]